MPSYELEAEDVRVLANMAAGMTTEAVGRKMGMARDKVRYRLKVIHRELGATNTTEAVAIGVRRGIIP